MVSNIQEPGVVAVRMALIPVDVAEALVQEMPQLKTWLIAQLELRIAPGAEATTVMRDIATLGPGFLQTTALPQGIKVPSPVPIDHQAAHVGRGRRLASSLASAGAVTSCRATWAKAWMRPTATRTVMVTHSTLMANARTASAPGHTEGDTHANRTHRRTAEGPCQHREHFPPSAMVYRPGTYQHRCPGCGHVTTFFVDTPIW